jgi:hypothetical protein
MKPTFTRPQLALAALLSTLGTFATGGEIALAQSVDIPNAPDAELSPSNEVNSTSPLGNGLNLNDLMHNANFSRSRNSSEFADDTQRKLKKAADEFKQMQLQQLQQPPATPAAPSGAAGN